MLVLCVCVHVCQTVCEWVYRGLIQSFMGQQCACAAVRAVAVGRIEKAGLNLQAGILLGRVSQPLIKATTLIN